MHPKSLHCRGPFTWLDDFLPCQHFQNHLHPFFFENLVFGIEFSSRKSICLLCPTTQKRRGSPALSPVQAAALLGHSCCLANRRPLSHLPSVLAASMAFRPAGCIFPPFPVGHDPDISSTTCCVPCGSKPLKVEVFITPFQLTINPSKTERFIQRFGIHYRGCARSL